MIFIQKNLNRTNSQIRCLKVKIDTFLGTEGVRSTPTLHFISLRLCSIITLPTTIVTIYLLY